MQKSQLFWDHMTTCHLIMKMKSFVRLIEKSFQRKIFLAFKCNFNKPNLTPIDASCMLLYKGPSKTPDHFAWRLVQGKINNKFDHKGFLREYQQIIPKIYELRDHTGIRILEWSNDNLEHPVRKMDMQLQSEVKETQVEAQENDKKSERPQKESLKLNEDDHCQT